MRRLFFSVLQKRQASLMELFLLLSLFCSCGSNAWSSGLRAVLLLRLRPALPPRRPTTPLRLAGDHVHSSLSPSSSASNRFARLVGHVASAQERQRYEAALEREGFTLLQQQQQQHEFQNNDNETSDTCAETNDCFAVSYKWNAASGMLQLMQTRRSSSSIADDDDDNSSLPRWIPLARNKENVLVANGWSFLDSDDVEPLSAFDIDAANAESLYLPKWGRSEDQQQQCTDDKESDDDDDDLYLSSLGFSLRPLTSQQILQQASQLVSEQTRQCLLKGATDPPGLKQTHSGHNFAGSVTAVEPGLFCCAIGGLPLFATADLSPTTATAGWLSFARPLSADHVRLVNRPQSQDDNNAGVDDQRVEVVCALTGCHLGHYFGGGGGAGYCINASALNFVSARYNSNNASGTDKSKKIQTMAPVVSHRALEMSETTPNVALLRQIVDRDTVTGTVLLGAGCFWHVEAALRRLPGVLKTSTGYAGGATPHPTTYEQVCRGDTGHAEVVRVDWDATVLEPRVLFDCFLALHDPTKVRAHGKHALHTGQYRSCIFVPAAPSANNDSGNGIERAARAALVDCQAQLGKELSTELRVLPPEHGIDDWFWPAEERHQRHDDGDETTPAVERTTLSASRWLSRYGKRTKSVLGSFETLSEAIAVDRLMI